jgi:hypothetical protein
LRSSALALIAAGASCALFAAGASASGSAQGPPAGPKSPPFTQCPAIGGDSTCEYLIDVTSSDPAVRPTVVQDATQHLYDGEDDVTVGVQNDTEAPLASIHVGVVGSADHLFAFDGDGLCSSVVSPKPAECPFNPSVSYDGPDTVLTPETPDAGTVSFPTPLEPGQYTYFTLEAAPTQGIVAGEVNDVVSTTLRNTQTGEEGAALTAVNPVAVTDRATIQGVHGAEATGTVEYVLYSDPNCRKQVESLGKKNVGAAGVAEVSNPSSALLATNATYYWLAKYTPTPGDKHNSPNWSGCGTETMTFGAPPPLPQPSITTVLSGGGQLGSHIAVAEGTPVTDTAIITAPGGQPVSGRVTYAAYANASCTGKQIAGLGNGGPTKGNGPATNPVVLGAGTYYFQAFYSGSESLRRASTQCGEEVLSVLPRPPLVLKSSTPVPPASPRGEFKLLAFQVNEKNGQIVLTVQLPAAGTATADGVVKQGASVARVGSPAAAAGHKKRCRHGFITQRGRCTSNAPVLYGAASLTSARGGIYRIVMTPTWRVLAALKKGRKLDVTLTTTFQDRFGGAPVTRLAHALVRIKQLKQTKHTKHRRH